MLRQAPGGSGGPGGEVALGVIEPAFGLRRSGDIEPIQQRAPVERQRTRRVTPLQGRLEGHRITPQLATGDTDLLLAPPRPVTTASPSARRRK